MKNIDKKVVRDFGTEWTEFDQKGLSKKESLKEFNRYFNIFPLDELNDKKVGADFGCGTGRWAKHIAPKVKKLYCIDPSSSLEVAKKNLSEFQNIVFSKSSVSNNPIEDNSLDFAYCLGVIHHIPDPKKGLRDCVLKIKKSSPFLLYLYYNLDNKSNTYKVIWKISDLTRRLICRFPPKIKIALTNLIAFFIYYPFARTALILEKLKVNGDSWPLYHYRDKSFYTMRTDSLDRFGTSLEHRFSKEEIEEMMTDCGLNNIRFYEGPPFWCAIGYRVS